MNLNDMITRVKGVLYETQAAPASEDPLGLVQFIVEKTDEVSRRSLSLYIEATTDISSASNLYCLPQNLWKLRQVEFLRDSGDWVSIPIKTTQLMDRSVGARWHTAISSDPPCIGVIDGVNFGIQFYPAPSTTRTAALRFGGLWLPGTVWGYTSDGTAVSVIDGNGIPNLTASNPLPTFAQDAVVYGAAVQRCWQFPTPENMVRLPHIEKRYEELVGQAHAAAATYSPAPKIGWYIAGAAGWR